MDKCPEKYSLQNISQLIHFQFCRNNKNWKEEKWFKDGLKIEKQELDNVNVIGQIDEKFIAIVTQKNYLMLLDQHAVDER